MVLRHPKPAYISLTARRAQPAGPPPTQPTTSHPSPQRKQEIRDAPLDKRLSISVSHELLSSKHKSSLADIARSAAFGHERPRSRAGSPASHGHESRSRRVRLRPPARRQVHGTASPARALASAVADLALSANEREQAWRVASLGRHETPRLAPPLDRGRAAQSACGCASRRPCRHRLQLGRGVPTCSHCRHPTAAVRCMSCPATASRWSYSPARELRV